MDIKEGYGIGEKLADKLKEVGINTIEDFIEMNFYDYCKMLDLEVSEQIFLRYRRFEFQKVKNWEIVCDKSDQIRKEVLLRVKNNKGIDHKEFNDVEKKALLLLLTEGMIYEPETKKYAYVWLKVVKKWDNLLNYYLKTI